jgi:hypothetical protein
MYSDWLHDTRGDMAEKAVVMAAIIVIAYSAYTFLGGQIKFLVNMVGGYL